MGTSEVSLHQVKVFMFIENSTSWVTNDDIVKATEVGSRTVRAHTKKLMDVGLLDHVDTFPGHRFRLMTKLDNRAKAYLQRLRQAIDVFGLNQS